MRDVISMHNSKLKVFYNGATRAGGYQAWDSFLQKENMPTPLECFTELLSRSFVTHNVLRETNSSET